MELKYGYIIIFAISFIIVVSFFGSVSILNTNLYATNNNSNMTDYNETNDIPNTIAPTLQITNRPTKTHSPTYEPTTQPTIHPSQNPTTKKPSRIPFEKRFVSIYYDQNKTFTGFEIGNRSVSNEYCYELSKIQNLTCLSTPMFITYKDDSIVDLPYKHEFTENTPIRNTFLNVSYAGDWKTFIYNYGKFSSNDTFWIGGIFYNFILGNCNNWNVDNNISIYGMIGSSTLWNNENNRLCIEKHHVLCTCIQIEPTLSPFVSMRPTKTPTNKPTLMPTKNPSTSPSISPTLTPTISPSILIQTDSPTYDQDKKLAMITLYSDNEVIGIDNIKSRSYSSDRCLVIAELFFGWNHCVHTPMLISFSNESIANFPQQYLFEKSSIIKSFNDIIISSSWDKLFTHSLLNSLYTSGVVNNAYEPYWTGSNSLGHTINNCNDWNSLNAYANVGNAHSISSTWLSSSITIHCSLRKKAICMCIDYIPTTSPTLNPTMNPQTNTPTNLPTSGTPTKLPTTKKPTGMPTERPSTFPTAMPTVMPTKKPSLPTKGPTIPTNNPTLSPSKYPTKSPTKNPTRKPTSTRRPTTVLPTFHPTKQPTINPTTKSPTTKPTTKNPTMKPTMLPIQARTFKIVGSYVGNNVLNAPCEGIIIVSSSIELTERMNIEMSGAGICRPHYWNNNGAYHRLFDDTINYNSDTGGCPDNTYKFITLCPRLFKKIRVQSSIDIPQYNVWTGFTLNDDKQCVPSANCHGWTNGNSDDFASSGKIEPPLFLQNGNGYLTFFGESTNTCNTHLGVICMEYKTLNPNVDVIYDI